MLNASHELEACLRTWTPGERRGSISSRHVIYGTQESRVKLIASAIASVLFLSATLTAQAATFPYTEAKVEITSPEKWKSAQDDDSVTFTAPDAEMSVIFSLLPAGAEAKAAEIIGKELDKAVGKITWEDKPEKEIINGMASEVWEGKAQGGKVNVTALYVDTPADRTLAIYWFSTDESEKNYEKEIEAIVKGIKPLAGK